MTRSLSIPPGPCLHVVDRPGGLAGIYLELAKVRMMALVALTTAVGFLLASGSAGAFDWTRLVAVIAGTGLTAVAASVFNQVMETDRDRLMPRTRNRPLPSGRISPTHAASLGIVSGGLGLSMLAAYGGLAACGLGALTLAIYLLVYTPLKVRSTLNTLVGSVVGAIPPLIGWVAVAGTIDPAGWALAGILFVWQIPHFLALAWLYRRDYAQGGYRMLPVIDPDGLMTARAAVIWALALLPVTLALTLLGATGWWYAAGALVLGLWLVVRCLRLLRDRGDDGARSVFLCSLAYLPLLLCLMLLDGPAPVASPPTMPIFPAAIQPASPPAVAGFPAP
ncbi:MAG: heme o synthase [Phycisphaerae bacterium]|nr:heme o synthase [Phycisphaerae bacterium]